ncbi:MAG: ATP-binding cassette domain-containing protein, partial [Planctomycetaceae bacterium]|nr:ATP-binding cassette domain-containing protein [Planctomycetaceae bacterium]
MPEPLLIVQELLRRHDSSGYVVQIKELEVFAQDFVVLLGPTGCGKTTVMHILGLLDRPTKIDRFELLGMDLQAAWQRESEIRGARRLIGYAFQRPELNTALTIRENVELPQRIHCVRNREARLQSILHGLGCRNATGQFDLVTWQHQRVHQLSGGQAQRVGLARALAHQPALLIADEPTSNLDPVTARSTIQFLNSLRESEGLTIVMVTHDPE